MNKIVGKVIRTVGYFIGFSVLLYPSVSNYLNQIHGTSVVSDYQQQVSHATEEEENRMFAEAQAYNQRLLGSISLEDPFEAGIKQENTEYEQHVIQGTKHTDEESDGAEKEEQGETTWVETA